jgi:hypothetical protein
MSKSANIASYIIAQIEGESGKHMLVKTLNEAETIRKLVAASAPIGRHGGMSNPFFSVPVTEAQLTDLTPKLVQPYPSMAYIAGKSIAEMGPMLDTMNEVGRLLQGASSQLQ